MSDFNDFATRIVTDYLQSPEGQEAAEKAIVSVLNDAIRNATRYGSPLQKQVDAALAEALQLREGIEIASYNDAILKIIQRQVEHATNEAIERQVAERVKRLLAPAPAEIKLSELIEQYRQYLKGRLEGGCVCYGETTMTFIRECERGVWHLFGLDEKAKKSRHECDIRFDVYEGKIYHLAFRNKDVENALYVGPLYDFHRSLFQMKAAGTRIVLDCEPGEVELDYGNDE